MDSLSGTVALRDRLVALRGCRDESVPESVVTASGSHSLRRLPVPARSHHARCAVVSPIRPSFRDVEELLVERGIEVDHVTIHRWVQRFTPLLIDAARPRRHPVGGRWSVDETNVKVAGRWRYVYRAVDEHGQVIDVFVSPRRNISAARTFFTTALTAHGEPDEVVTDLAQALETVIEELIPNAFHNTEQYANNRVECDHGRLKARLRPMRGLKTDRTASVMIRGHAFIQNLRRNHYELGASPRHQHLRLVDAFDDLIATI